MMAHYIYIAVIIVNNYNNNTYILIIHIIIHVLLLLLCKLPNQIQNNSKHKTIDLRFFISIQKKKILCLS